jgi:transcriptional regulator with XRE-family HTH domain
LISQTFSSGYPSGVVTREQIRAGRALIGWSQRELADQAEVSLSAVKAIETGKDVRVSVLARIEAALIRAGLLFLEPGDTRTGGRGVRFQQ